MENLLRSAHSIREGTFVGANGDGRTAGTHDLTRPASPNGTDVARLTREGVGAEPTRGCERITGRKPEDLASRVGHHRAAFEGSDTGD